MRVFPARATRSSARAADQFGSGLALLYIQAVSSLYLDAKRYDAERQKLFMKLPLPLAPSAYMKEPDSFVCRDSSVSLSS